MCKKHLRPAIAMIELIFAIVIMGIVLMSAPQLMQTAAKSGYVAIQQEAIGEAASRINMIMGYDWDENDANESFDATILTVTNGASDLNNTATGRRVGTPLESYRTFLRSDGAVLAATPIGSTGEGDTEADDIDDFDNTDTNLTNFTGASMTEYDADYIEKGDQIKMHTTVAYNADNTNNTPDTYQRNDIRFIPFRSTSGTNNIKSITVTLTSTSGVSELNKTIVLKAFSCNVGSYRLESKDF